ncbi:MAG: beta-propeller fold lactonase family protein [Pirellulaceae bacterium]|nr:beta-propeller fold lactonase family protein [Pirellulaceae bacterium]
MTLRPGYYPLYVPVKNWKEGNNYVVHSQVYSIMPTFMPTFMSMFKSLLLAAFIVCASDESVLAQANNGEKLPTQSSSALHVVQNVELSSLKGVVGLAISADGRFLYAPGYMTGTIHVFSIDPKSGRLELVEKQELLKQLAGATDFCLSPDGKLGLTSAFRSKAATLFRRDAESGRLAMLQSITSQTEKEKGYQWPIRGTFSTDGKFAYVVDCGISQSFFIKNAPAVLVFKVADEKIEFVESFQVAGYSLANVRGIAVHPNGKHIFVTTSDGKSLLLLGRKEATGKLELVQNMSEPKDMLEGAMSVLTDPSGKFVYALSGRFRGKGGVAVFAFDEQRASLSFLESHLSGSAGLEQFKGGNQLALSSDGLRLYAIGSTSGTISTFKRDPAAGTLIAMETNAIRPQWKESVAGVIVSPDSKFVYVSGGEKDPSITVLSTSTPPKPE